MVYCNYPRERSGSIHYRGRRASAKRFPSKYVHGTAFSHQANNGDHEHTPNINDNNNDNTNGNDNINDNGKGTGGNPTAAPQSKISEPDPVEFEEDIYSLLFITKVRTNAFWISFAVFGIQMMVLVLLILDLLNKEDEFALKNPLKAPLVKNDGTVIMAQYIAIIIAIVTQDELVNTIGLVTTSFHTKALNKQISDFKSSNRDASMTAIVDNVQYWRFILCSLGRFTAGLLTITTSFLFIVQSDNILDMFMNFAALEFVSELDNMAFQIATQNFCGNSMAQAAELVKGLSLPVTRPHLRWIQRSIFLILLLGMASGLGVLQRRQANGVFLYDSSCLDMYITLGDAVLDLQHPFYFGDTKRDVSLFADDIQNATLFKNDGSEQPEESPDLVYSFFSGTYKTNDNDRPFNRRPVYYQDGLKGDSTAGMFYYCDGEQAWVFTIPALHKNIPSESWRDCEHGWLMQSPITTAASLEDAPLEGWNVWTGAVDKMDIRISCTQCIRDSDCGLQNGRCTSKTQVCECNEGFIGLHCEEDARLCPEISWIKYGSSSSKYKLLSTFTPLRNADPDESSDTIFIYGRPAYVAPDDSQNPGLTGIVFYTGSRWIEVLWDSKDLNDIQDIGDNPIHAFWHVDRGKDMIAFSAATGSFYPAHNQWFFTRKSASTRDDSPVLDQLFGIHYEGDEVALECSQPVYKLVADTEPDGGDYLTVCGLFGTPNEKTKVCDCFRGYSGVHCEFSPASEYVLEQSISFLRAIEKQVDPDTDKIHSYERNAFHDMYWSQYTEQELYDALCREVSKHYACSFVGGF